MPDDVKATDRDTWPSDATQRTPLAQDVAGRRRVAFEGAEASLALEGMRPAGPLYERVRADVIAGRISFDQAATELSALFGPDVE